MELKYWVKRPFVVLLSRKQKDIIRKKLYDILYDFDAGKGAKIVSPKEIKASTDIGRYTTIGEDSKIRGSHEVEIGNFCSIAEEVRFQSTNHNSHRLSVNYRLNELYLNTATPAEKEGGIKVGNDVWIGAGAIILSDVEIGNGAIIGAGAVVTRDVEDFEIVGGVPAENIGYRFTEEIRERILDLEWWKMELDELKSIKSVFDNEINRENDIVF